jgi:hypothetical protein
MRVAQGLCVAFLAGTGFVACGGGLDGDTLNEARESAARWGGFQQSVDELVGRIQTVRDSGAKRELLERCEAQVVGLQRTESRFTTVARTLCADIEVEGVGSSAARWSQIALRAGRIAQGLREEVQARAGGPS